MKKLIIPILVILVVVAGTGGYFFGFGQGKSVIQKELQSKEAEYQKSREAAKTVAEKYLSAFKFKDFKEAYSLTCPDFKKSATEQKFIKYWEDGIQSLQKDAGAVIQDYILDEVVVEGEIAKVRFNEVRNSAFLAKEIKLPQQSQFKLVEGSWCPMPPTDF